jgi:hypothetical protein
MKNKKLIWIGVASALLIGGGIFWWWKSRNPSDSSGDTSKDETKKDDTKDDTKTDTSTSGGGSGASSNPLGDSSAVKAFQDWLDVKHPNWLNGGRLNKGSGYGNFGSNTKRAFDNYGSEYKSGSSTTSSPSSSGFRAGNKLYTKKGAVNVYKYPDNISKNRLGFIVQSANSQATFKADANTKGYIIAVTKYKTPDGRSEVVGDTYILASEVTNVAP